VVVAEVQCASGAHARENAGFHGQTCAVKGAILADRKLTGFTVKP
jgi:hypothetical protein